MPYFIVAEQRGVVIFNRADTAAEGLELAVLRRRAGAEAVYVRDEAWALVPASALEQSVERERSGRTAPAEAVTVRLSAAPEPPRETALPSVRSGRVRVFKAAGVQRPRS